MTTWAGVVCVSLLATMAGAAHECERTCVSGDTRTCMYEFRLQEYHTLSRACFDCPSIMSDCLREDCVVGAGVARPVLTVNRQLPGPDIQVCEGDRLVVDVINEQLSDMETIHWHGQHMYDYQYFDGVPLLTQCPIMGMGGMFRYDFPATASGTHLWHSHVGLHRGSGVFGAVVVRQAEDPHREAYDEDRVDHVLVVSEWHKDSVFNNFVNQMQFATHTQLLTLLINGKGRTNAARVSGIKADQFPLEVVEVSEGLRYRLRFINGGSFNCPLVVSADNHTLTIIAVDGYSIIPYTTDSLVILSGERFDVVLEANQPVDNYWLRFNGIQDCARNECVQGAIVRYEGAPVQDPTVPLTYSSTYPPGVVVNPLDTGGGTATEVSVVDLTSLQPSTLTENVDKQFYLAFDIKTVNNTLMFNPDLYPFNEVNPKWRSATPQLNGLTFKFPKSPPLSQPEEPLSTACLYGEDPPCEGDFCSCTYILEVGLGETVELVLVDEGTLMDTNHPFHLHGYNFHVVAMDRLGSSTTVDEVAALDASGGITRKLEDAVMKDTVTIPDGGYTIVRFTADNPGYWIFHCHLVIHSEMGMVGVLHVGDTADLPPVPQGFPTCGSYTPPMN